MEIIEFDPEGYGKYKAANKVHQKKVDPELFEKMERLSALIKKSKSSSKLI